MHFTYEENFDASSLKQGDVLEKTDQLNELLARYHSHYTNPEYTHFQVLTQSCDLVRRGSENKCSARYITLAAVRSLDTVIERAILAEADKKVDVGGKLFCSDAHKDRLAFSISSLLNNNSKDHFYLHAVPGNKLVNDSCTFLHLSIAIRAHEHYDLCLNAKIIELKESFRAKLGWMVGNIYSRVGTEDFVPSAISTSSGFKEYIDELLLKYIGWVPRKAFAAFKQSANEGEANTFDELFEKAAEKLKKKQDERIDGFASQLKQQGGLSSEQFRLIKEYLQSEKGRRYISKPE